MVNFNYYAPTNVLFGRGVEEQVGEIICGYGFSRILVHFGGGSVKRSGLLDRVLARLESAGVGYVLLGGVVPNPRISLVREGIGIVRKEKLQMILAIGGGSVIDSSKAIGYGVASGGDPWDFYSGKRKPTGCLPVGVILTIAAAGSEMSNSSVLTNEEEVRKKGCSNDLCRPLFALMNPELTMTLPPYQTSCGCTDIVMHSLERWFNRGGTMDLTDAISAGLIRTVMRSAAVLMEHPDDYEARANVMWAGSLSHNGLTGCGGVGRGDWITHNMEHEVGAIFDVSHGAGLAALWGSWARYVLPSCTERFVKFATMVMDVPQQESDTETALEGIRRMEAFFRSLNMPTSLAELGVFPTEEQMRLMAHKCSGGGTVGRAADLDENDLYNIYKAAL